MYDYQRLINIGISYQDAAQLRRIAMTLHRWHELECGDGNEYASWSIVRGRATREVLAGGSVRRGFEYAEDGEGGAPYLEQHFHQGDAKPSYTRIADRENGAKRRLKRIMASYPGLWAYIQTDPRGAALYVGPGELVDHNYTRGVAVYK